MPTTVIKRDRTKVPFEQEKITRAIFKAATAVGGHDYSIAEHLSDEVTAILEKKYPDGIVDVEDVQDTVEKVLIENGKAKTAKAYILYREKHRSARENNALIGATINMFSDYLGDKDWRINENANMQKSLAGLNNYVREAFTRNYWLYEVYPDYIRNAHLSGDIALHDLGSLSSYCAGWDLRQILMNGFGGVPKKIESKPPKHFRALLGQIVNSTFTTQGETAGAQAWSSFDTFCAPFIRYDKLDYASVKQALQEFVFNMNVPTRVGFQCPFSNLTFDLVPPRTLKDQPVIIGGKYMDETYGDFQAEMDMLNLAFCEVMMEGDAKGRVFTFPIPTINVTKDFQWDSPVVNKFMEITCKYGIPYFSNYINSDLLPEDALSMCPMVADTLVTARIKGEVKRESIESLYKRLLKRNNSCEVWTSDGWCNASVNITDPTSVYKITFSNGATVSFGENHLQPIRGGNVLSAKELSVGMWIPFNKYPIENGTLGSRELGFVVGAYIGDGSHDEDSVIYSLNSLGTKDAAADRIIAFWNSIGHKVSDSVGDRNVRFVRIRGNAYQLIRKYVSGDYSTEKSMSKEIFDSSLDFRIGVIEGMMATDGSTSKKRYYTSSARLREDVSSLLSSIGRKYIANNVDSRDGRLGTSPVYRIDMPERKSYGDLFDEDENYHYFKIVGIEKQDSYDKPLYCFSVDNYDHLFMLSNGLITHNCRLRLNLSDLRKRGGGLFGSNPLTGSVGISTINLPRIGYLAKDEPSFFEFLEKQMVIAKESLEIKREVIEEQTERGLYPYCAHYLKDTKAKTGSYWYNHFNTIGLVGMNEACLNLLGKSITTPEGQEFSIRVLNFMRDVIQRFQEETGHVYNLEATPAEGTSYRLAEKDKERYPDIITAGKDVPYYTNSSQLPVGFTDDVFETLDLQDELQSLYTGGTVLHLYLGEEIKDIEVAKRLLKKAFTNYKLPYISFTPTFSICNDHGYIAGEHFTCPTCGEPAEVWSRVVGYLRPVQNYNIGKKEEYKLRKKYVIGEETV